MRPAPRLAMLVLLVAPTCLTPVLLVGPASAVDTTTCQGRPVTQVVRGQGGTDVYSTPGDDVVVVESTSFGDQVRVHTLAGDDTVCFVGLENISTLDTGPGDDLVSTVGAVASTTPFDGNEIDLGPGADTFIGGDAADSVGADTPADAAGDRIDLGGGADSIDGLTLPVVPVNGGTGRDTVLFGYATTTVSVDNVAHTVTTPGSVAALGADFEAFVFVGGDTISVRGGATAESVTVAGGPGRPPRSLTTDLGAGNDRLYVPSGLRGTWRGGDGADRLDLHRASRDGQPAGTVGAVVDLGRSIRVPDAATVGIGGFEVLDVTRFADVVVRGTSGADDIHVASCAAEVSAGGGRDRVDVDSTCGRDARTVLSGGRGADQLRGGRGDDRLGGGPGDDVLLGRRGLDRADGGPGRDRCVAERRTSC